MGAPKVSHLDNFRSLMNDGDLLVMPGAYDAMSARLIAAAGFKAIFAGGNAAIGSLLAQPDMGQSNMRDYADHYARISEAAGDVPVFVDADTGFGGVHNVRQAVRAFEASGVAGLFIQDQVFPNRCGYLPGKQLVPVEQMIAKIKAALDARRSADFFIAARTDAAGVDGLDAAIERSQLYMDAGADMALPQGVDTPEGISRVIREVPGPFMAIASQAAGNKAPDLAGLAGMGVSAVILPTLTLMAAAKAVETALHHIATNMTVRGFEDRLMPMSDYYGLVGLAALNEREESYDRAGAAFLLPRP